MEVKQTPKFSYSLQFISCITDISYLIHFLSSWILLNSNYNITLSFICLEIIQKSKN